MEEIKQPVEKRMADIAEFERVARKQLRELWTQLESWRTEYTELVEEQKVFLGFLDCEQKQKFGLLQKDVGHLLTLYGTDSRGGGG